MLTTSVGYHSEHLKMDPDGMALGGGNTHPDPFSGGSPPFTGGNEEEFEPVQLPPGALSEEQQAAVQQSHSALHSLHHPGASVASSHYPPHYSHLSAQLYHQQHSHHSHPHPHHSHHPQQPPPPSQWNPYGMNGYVGTGATGGGYHPLHHAPPMDASSYYYSSASGPPPNAQPPPSAYHPSNPSGGGQQSMALPGGPSPAGSHNTPSPQAHSEDGDNSDPHLRNNNVLKRPAVDYSSSSPHVHSLMNPGSYHPPLPPAKKAKAPKRKKKRDPNEPQKPVSAYALFFRDSQANIKAANPNAAFGDVSKIVASMWDGLDPDNKAAYKKRTENAKKEYLKKLAAYRASLVSKGSGSPINESGSTSVAGSNPSSAPPSSSNNHPPSYGPGAGPYAPYSYGEPPNNSNTGMKPSPNDGYNGPNSTPYPNSQQQLPRQPSYGPPVGAYLHPNQQMSNGGYGHHHPVSHPPSSVLPPNSTAPSDNRSSSSPPSGPSPLDSRTHLDPTTGHLVETEGGGAPPNGSNSNNANGAHHLHQQHHPHSSSGSNSSNNRGRRPLSCARPGCNNPISSNEAWSSNSEFCSNECVVGQCRDVYSSWSGASGPPSTAPPPPPPPNGQVQTQ